MKLTEQHEIYDLFRRAEDGDTDAMVRLGDYYEDNRQDVLSYAWFKRASVAGDPYGTLEAARHIVNYYSEISPEEVRAILEKAANIDMNEIPERDWDPVFTPGHAEANLSGMAFDHFLKHTGETWALLDNIKWLRRLVKRDEDEVFDHIEKADCLEDLEQAEQIARWLKIDTTDA